MKSIVFLKYQFYYYFAIILILSSCQATSFLDVNETFLYKNRIKIISPEKIANKPLLKEELNTFLQQVPNENILWVNRQWFYYIYKDKETNRFNKFILKNLAQEPSIYSEEFARITSENFKKFLRDKRGFYNVDVSFKANQVNKYLANVEYTIQTGNQYTINSVKYTSDDPKIDSILINSVKNSLFVIGEPVNSANYDLERIRITNLLQNEGYAGFSQENIELHGDSSDFKTNLNVLIKNPGIKKQHQVYKIGQINVFTDYYPTQHLDSLNSIEIDGIRFYKEFENFLISPKQIGNAISFRSGEVFSKEKSAQIYSRLSRFSIYKFISIKNEIDTLNEGYLNCNIYMFLNEHKYSYEGGTSINYLRLGKDENLLNTGLMGVLTDKRVSDRGDNLSLDGSGDIKINLKDGSFHEVNLVSKLEYSYPNTAYTIKATPVHLINKFVLKNTYENLKSNVISNLSLSYSYMNFIYDFQISSFNINYGYNFLSKKDGLRMHFSQAGLNYNNNEIFDDEVFNEFQKKSLNDFFQTGILFKNFTLDYNNHKPDKKFSIQSIIGIEISGSEIFLLNKLYNKIEGSSDYWTFNKNVNYAKFVKANIDLRPHFKLNKTDLIAGRIYAGIGSPFGDSQSLPYIKQFEVGGPASMRGWTARSLGPGSYHDTVQIDYPFQRGDLRLEGNIEYRFKLSSYFRSALFIDAGNIWTLGEDPERIGSQFTRRFYKQIAVNAGISFQLDVFLLLRFDLAFKLRNPYQNQYGRYWDFKSFSPTFVFSINNPF